MSVFIKMDIIYRPTFRLTYSHDNEEQKSACIHFLWQRAHKKLAFKKVISCFGGFFYFISNISATSIIHTLRVLLTLLPH